jgi:A/G-specific adenine glycosylase
MAKTLRATHHGRVPWLYPDLLKLPGIGTYIASAVRSFAFGIQDGNVIRILERVYGVTTPGKSFRERARYWLPKARRIARSANHREINYALLDLGANLCRPHRPECATCPLKQICATGQRR